MPEIMAFSRQDHGRDVFLYGSFVLVPKTLGQRSKLSALGSKDSRIPSTCEKHIHALNATHNPCFSRDLGLPQCLHQICSLTPSCLDDLGTTARSTTRLLRRTWTGGNGNNRRGLGFGPRTCYHSHAGRVMAGKTCRRRRESCASSEFDPQPRLVERVRPMSSSRRDPLKFFPTSKRQNSRPVSLDEISRGAKERAEKLVAGYVPILPTEGDMRCIQERQLRHPAGTVAVSSPCRHGFPQAFAFDPVGHKLSSGLFRLSCPLLVQAIDELEDEGGIEDVNARLEGDGDLREDFMAVNLAHGNLRRRFISAERAREVQESIGEKSFEVFVSSGITGLTPGKVRDAKCLHAHVADALMRGREANAIGSSTLDLLEARGVGSSGCDRCREQCDYNMEETEDTWRYTPQKNKQRLFQRKVRRKAIKVATAERRERKTGLDAKTTDTR